MIKESFIPTLAAAVLCLSDARASAQPATPALALPRVFVGGGVTTATNDAGSRMRLFEDSRGIWFLEGGAALSARFGLGVEFVQPTAVTTSTSGRFGTSWGRQEERALLGLVRGRVGATERIALDVVGGAGLLFQRHEIRFAPCIGCPLTPSGTLANQAPALAFGADIPVRVGRGLVVAGVARCYVLRRGDHVSNIPSEIFPWQHEWKSSTRFGVGISARAVW